MKMKKYSLKLSQKFMRNHPRCGEDTFFKMKYRLGEKKHTIRENIEYWSRVVDEVNAGRAYLAIEYWSGKPYWSKPIEIDRLYKLGKQIIYMDKIHEGEYEIVWTIDGNVIAESLITLARNDGLKYMDFLNWFFKPKKAAAFKGIIIHFTDLRY